MIGRRPLESSPTDHSTQANASSLRRPLAAKPETTENGRRSFLLSRGMIAHGAVTKVGPTSVRINHVTQWRVHYRYLDHMGMQREGKSDYRSPDEAQKWREGQSGEIRSHPDKPEQSLWVG